MIGLAASPFLTFTAPNAQSRAYDVVVIGAGVFGAWTAWHLVKAGRRVAIVDAYGPANARASSGGESRVIRVAYGGDALYSRWSKAALPHWQALSERQSLPIFHRTGVLWFSPVHDAYIDQSLATLDRLNIKTEIMNRPRLEERYPQINFDDIAVGFLENDSGGLMARRAVQAVIAEAVEDGADFLLDAAGAPSADGSGLHIPLRSGQRLKADTAVYACGPWLPRVFPDILGGRIVASRQEVFYFGPAAGDARFSPPAMPVWADFNDGDIFYGLPDLESRGFKIAHDAHGPPVDPDTANRRPRPAALATVRRYLARRFPGLAAAPLLEARVCQYENTSSGDFLIDRHPELEQVWLVGGGSGHGFKHGPTLGRYVADRIRGEAGEVDRRFLLAGKKSDFDRSVH